MSRTTDRFYADVAHAGGLIKKGAIELAVISTATAPTLTRNAANDYSLNRIAGGVETIQIVAGVDSVRRLIESYQAQGAFQEAFNMAPPAPGRPPFTGVTQFATPTQAGPPKGIQVDDVYIVYRVGIVGLTSLALSFAEIKFGENVAVAPTVIPTTGVPLITTQAQNHVATFPVTAPGFIVDDLSDLQAEFTIVMANTGTLRVYAVGFHTHFNYD